MTIKAQFIPICLLALLSATGGLAEHYYPHCPVVYSVSPSGAQRGIETEIVVEGINLDAESRFLFSAADVTGKVLDVQDVPNEPYLTPRQQMRITLSVGPDVVTGIHGFRVGTRFGTSNWIPFAVDRLVQVAEVEHNDAGTQVQVINCPVTVLGTISAPGEQDRFQFEASAGDEVVIQVTADVLESPLDSVISLLDADGNVIARNNNSSVHNLDSMLGHRFQRDGRYFAQVTDRAGGGGADFCYRLSIGRLPYITRIFPLGVQKGETVLAQVEGFNLDGISHVKLDGRLAPDQEGTRVIRVETPRGECLNTLRIAVGDYEETYEQEGNDQVAQAQPISPPVTINARVDSGGEQDLFRFRARKGQVFALEVVAHRLGSPLDSCLEVLDAQGEPVPQAVLRAVHAGSYQLPTSSRSLQLQRFQSDRPYYGGDFVFLSDRELVRLEEGTTHSDDFSLAQGFLGQRVAWLGTTTQNHAEGFSAYKVEILDPGSSVNDSSLPVFHLNYHNDDGGPVHGKDSYLLFTAPEDGQYIARLRDLRGTGGPQFSYRLTVRPAKPDFRLFLDDTFMQLRDLRATGARNPNVPVGGRVPLVVSAHRIDGFTGEIQVEAQDLPARVESSVERIRADEFQSMLVFSASDTAAEQIAQCSLTVTGRARIDGKEIRRTAIDVDGGLNLISVVPAAIVRPVVQPQQVVLEPGGSAELHVSMHCPDDFAHEIGVEVKNRPPGVFVPGRSTNAGQAIAAGERSRTLALKAAPGLLPMTFPVYVVIRFRSEQAEKMKGLKSLEESADYVSEPVLVTIK